MRRAGSIVSIHLSGNPGLSEQNKKYICERVRCRPNENMDRFNQIQNLVNYTPLDTKQLKQGIANRMYKFVEF
jgi:hypothetical protein